MNETNTIKKVCRIGRIPDADTRNDTKVSVYIKIETKDHLSISGVIGPLRSGNARGSCGQIDMNFKHRRNEDDDTRYKDRLIPPEAFKFAKGWDRTKWLDLLDIWKRWHLKDIKTVPKDVLEFIKQLPDADKQPAWC